MTVAVYSSVARVIFNLSWILKSTSDSYWATAAHKRQAHVQPAVKTREKNVWWFTYDSLAVPILRSKSFFKWIQEATELCRGLVSDLWQILGHLWPPSSTCPGTSSAKLQPMNYDDTYIPVLISANSPTADILYLRNENCWISPNFFKSFLSSNLFTIFSFETFAMAEHSWAAPINSDKLGEWPNIAKWSAVVPKA